MITDELQRYYDGIRVDPEAEQRVIAAVTSRTVPGADHAGSSRRRSVWLVAAVVAAVAAIAAATIGIQSALEHRSLPPVQTPPAVRFVITFHAHGVTLNSISCSTATDCTAVGEKGRHGAGFALAGGVWHAVPALALSAALTDVSCTRSGSCMATGFGVAAWRATSGSAWRPVALPRLLTGPAAGGIGVDCSSATACVAVSTDSSGRSRGQAARQSPVAFRWNGRSWSRMPNLPVRPASQLSIGVSCWAADGCRVTTSGQHGRSTASSMLIWDGSRWSAEPPFPDLAAHRAFFGDLACTSATNCVDVGYKQDGRDFGAEVLTGGSWRWHPFGPVNAHTAEGGAVTCSSASSCLYVGTVLGTHGSEVPEVEVWNGTTWSPGPAAATASYPNPTSPRQPVPPTRVYGTSVTCLASGACMFTGSERGSRGDTAFIEYSPRH